MKNKILTLALALMAALLLTTSSFAADENIGYVTDNAGILTESERDFLEQTAEDISTKYGFGVYIVTVDDFREFTDSYDVFDGAIAIYKKYRMGIGEDRGGVMLLLSMDDRDFSLITYSDYGNFVFDTETREAMTSWFLDDFAYDSWASGFSDYLELCSDILADGPDKVRNEIRGMVGIIFILPLIVAFIAISILGRRMKSVAKATQAMVYTEDGLELTNSHDILTHSTETRRKHSSESSGGSSVRSRSSGGFGGTSGKF